MTDEQKKVLEKAIEHYGKYNQTIKFVEEVGELLQAYGKFVTDTEKHRKRKEVYTDGVPTVVCGLCEHNNNMGHLREEIADCIITLQQMRLIYGPEEVDWWVNFKLERLNDRIEKEKRSV